MTKKPFVVLMAEDSQHDIVATKRAWKKNNILNPLHIVRDGEECLDYLHQRGKYSEPGSAPTGSEPGFASNRSEPDFAPTGSEPGFASNRSEPDFAPNGSKPDISPTGGEPNFPPLGGD